MGDRWSGQLPPDEAYSRVTRDLAEVTAGFRSFVDTLPARLEAEFECAARPVTPTELQRLADVRSTLGISEAWAVEPASKDSATVLLSSHTYEGGTMAVLAFGRAMADVIPVCFCDACDEDSESLIEMANRLVNAATGGCREFRRPYVNQHDDVLHDGPWQELGYSSLDGSDMSCAAGASIRGAAFSQLWQPWASRDLDAVVI